MNHSLIPLKRAIRYVFQKFDTLRGVSNNLQTLRIALKGITEDGAPGSLQGA